MITRLTRNTARAIALGIIVWSAACASAPVKQVQVGIADQITAISAAVVDLQNASHAAAVANGTPTALGVDQKVQQAARAYGVDALAVLAKVKAAPTTTAALVAGAPFIAQAQAVLAALVGAHLSPAADAKAAALDAKLAALGKGDGR